MDAELKLFKKPAMLKRLANIRKHIYPKICNLQAFITTDVEPIPFEDRFTRAYRLIKPGEKWGKAFNCAWFNFKGTLPDGYENKKIVAIIDIDAEGLVVDSTNKPLYALSSRLSWVDWLQSTRGKTVFEYKGSKDVDIWVDAGFNGKIAPPFFKARFKKAYLAEIREDVKSFYYDFLTACFYALSLTDKTKQKIAEKLINKAYQCLKKFHPIEVLNASNILNELKKSGFVIDEDYQLTAIGHSHLDQAWLWPIRETKRKAVRTFTNQINNILKYPDYIYGASQPQQFAWLKASHPLIYARLQELVKQGVVELQGGFWVEPDTNLPSGESLIRQALYGKRFFKDEFGQDMRLCWLPDAFGYNANLPQILTKTGMDYFMTIKLSWNEHNEFPHHTFIWEGIDGSRVLVHMPPEGNYNSGATPLSIKKVIDNYKEKNILKDALLVYGTGDGGGGPGEVHLELLYRQTKQVKFGKAIDFFERIKVYEDKLPIYKGELYLEKHQGTYTTQSKNKFYNRKIEFLLHDVEFLATLCFLKGYKYPHRLLERIWKEVLLYQFHDILPGSSIKRVHEESVARYGLIMKRLELVKGIMLKRLASGEDLNLINTTSFTRKGYLEINDTWYQYEVNPYSASKLEPLKQVVDLNYGEDYIENDRLYVKFSPKGYIISLYDKEHKMELSDKYLNRLVIYKDKWKFFNAWDIDINYPKKRKVLMKLIKREIFIDGPRVICRQTFIHHKTLLTQDISLTSGCRYLVFDTKVDFKERFRMLRADFKPTVYSDTVKCEIQFGHFNRSTRNNTAIEKAQFEICAHKWIELEDNQYRLVLINDCKYGHRVKAGIMSLNLLRSPKYPDPTADISIHRFKYALYPHKGTLNDTIKAAYHFNIEPIIANYKLDINSFASVSCDGVCIETIKKAEDTDGIIIRLYEALGSTIETTISVNFSYQEVYECDLLEKKLKLVDLNKIVFTPFEVKTLLFTVNKND